MPHPLFIPSTIFFMNILGYLRLSQSHIDSAMGGCMHAGGGGGGGRGGGGRVCVSVYLFAHVSLGLI